MAKSSARPQQTAHISYMIENDIVFPMSCAEQSLNQIAALQVAMLHAVEILSRPEANATPNFRHIKLLAEAARYLADDASNSLGCSRDRIADSCESVLLAVAAGEHRV